MNATKKLIVKNGNLREKREGTVYQLRFSMIEDKKIILRVKNITISLIFTPNLQEVVSDPNLEGKKHKNKKKKHLSLRFRAGHLISRITKK
jgi:hypothetical protein